MRVPFVDLKTQYNAIKPEIKAAIDEVLDNTAYVLGKPVANFEKNFAEAHNVKHCIGVSSGTDGNHLVLWALGVGHGDEVIIPADTFIATAWGATLCGATPVFADVHPVSYNLNPVKVAEAITPRTKAIVAVHLYGQPSDMDAISEQLSMLNYQLEEQGVFVNKKTGQKIFLVEDCAQSHISEYKGKKVGALGAASSFSFYPGKNLGAYGEGGAVCTNDDALAKIFRMMRDHGSFEKYKHMIYGHNYRMEGLQGAVLGVKLNHLEKWTAGRRQAAEWYRKYLGGCEHVVLPAEMDYAKHVYHLFVAKVNLENPLLGGVDAEVADSLRRGRRGGLALENPISGGDSKRDELAKYLNEREIATGLHYPIPLHLQLCFAHLGYKQGDMPVTEDIATNGISLPMFPEITEEQVKYVSENIIGFFSK
ncbi:MAG: DegT/DnrJ/EryC1/StrS family aminotransferase [Ignavibacteria bacterium]|nr:DegT/DnrJ/EryC1/StrS family aminotransferase [Ignavibacteria bacterium]